MAFNAPALEQSTLVYHLTSQNECSWADFSLIVRSLHNFRVISLAPDEDSQTITVTVGYFANLGNAIKRLGKCAEFVEVTRLSSNVDQSELPNLQSLQRKFGFGGTSTEEEPTAPVQNAKKRKYAARH